MGVSERAKRVVVVTGASAGVGRATALAFASRGWAVGLLARGVEGLEGARQDVEEAGGEALALPADVADAEAVFAAARKVASRFGGIDVWVNNAMATIFAPVEKITPEEFRRVTEVTYLGQVHGTLAALRHMKRRGRGTIVQVGSALAYRSIPLQSAYCAAKAAARAFTDSLRSELIHEGSPIRVTMVHLPAVNTPQFELARSRLPRRLQPVPPIFEPEPIAEEIFRAAREAPRELWVGMPTMRAILAQTMAPGLLDHLAAKQAWEGQMTKERRRSRPDNLFEPVPGDHGAHGRFGRRARDSVNSASAETVRALVGALGAAALAAAGIGIAAGLASARAERLPAPPADEPQG